jgi:hypothetical protein
MQARSNISAARQYNESPNFQRMTDINTDPYLKTTSTANTQINSNHQAYQHTNGLAQNYNTSQK